MFHAIPHQTKGRVATATPGCGQQKHSADMGKEGHTEVCEQIPGHLSEQYGGGTQRSSGSIFPPRRRQDVRLPSRGDAPEHTEESTFRENAKRLQGRRHRNTQDINGKGPGDPCLNPQEYLRNMEAGTMPPMNNHQMMKAMAENAAVNDQTKFLMMEFRDINCPTPPKTPLPQKRK